MSFGHHMLRSPSVFIAVVLVLRLLSRPHDIDSVMATIFTLGQAEFNHGPRAFNVEVGD